MSSSRYFKTSLLSFHRRILPLAVAFAALPGVTFGCSVCGCSLSSDWALQGYNETAGLQVSLRDEYYKQSDLRNGTHNANLATIDTSVNEIQQETLNRNIVLGLDYVASPNWAVSLQLPYYDRFHSTIQPGDTDISTSHATGLGDVRVLGRYQVQQGHESSWSVQLGLKLPTGGINQNFATGPAAGTPLDRGLQLGTGTTDLLAGVSHFSRPGLYVSWFAQVLLDQPLAARDGFIPSSSVNANTGIRWLNTSAFTPELQLNATWNSREHGINADSTNSGGVLVHVSPGLSADLTTRLNAFAFLQLPVYQRVSGLQLEARWLLASGLRYSW